LGDFKYMYVDYIQTKALNNYHSDRQTHGQIDKTIVLTESIIEHL